MTRRYLDLVKEESIIGLLISIKNFVKWRWYNGVDLAYYNVMKLRYKLFHGGMVDIVEEDWDNLVILDGCRYDLFYESTQDQFDEIDYRISQAPSTPKFLRSNISNRELHDTVYVTANPQYVKENLESRFHAVIPVWKSEWDDEKNTVLPKEVLKVVKLANESYPNKRLLVHFMQPHYPFLGDTAR